MGASAAVQAAADARASELRRQVGVAAGLRLHQPARLEDQLLAELAGRGVGPLLDRDRDARRVEAVGEPRLDGTLRPHALLRLAAHLEHLRGGRTVLDEAATAGHRL